MPEFYEPRYYTLDLIPDHWLEYIDVRLKWFIKVFNISPATWPIDCIKIIEKMAVMEIIPFTYGFVDMPNKVDALAKLEPYPGFNPGLYMILINKNKVRYPYATSRDRRTNFTIAHELAHIALGHLLVPINCKSPYEIFLDDLMADEFAGRFLMPKNLVLTANLNPIDAAAKHFIVSRQALWKRLNHLKRLDLLHSFPFIVCSTCGNKQISPYAEYCCICGCQLNDSGNGVATFDYLDGYVLDEEYRLTHCPVCGNEEFSSNAQYCRICGMPLYNYCSNWHYEQCYHQNHGNARFCELCGSPTVFYSHGLLTGWEQAKNNYYDKLLREDKADYFFKMGDSR
ncbi:MAG: ImmA/IrrE family metallo-endopeptidase [Peptococcaceae bacterium]|nr:ImmA/IrrE family metallo-endopeptidase [Peptococcaceae bacterium]